jgi:hypothetical protein
MTTLLDPGELSVPEPPTRRRPPTAALVVVAVMVLAVIAGLGAVALARGGSEPTVPRSPAVEVAFGVRITSVTVTGDGGLVDLRFVVLDPSKAAALMASRDLAPRLAADHDGEVVFLPAMTMHRPMTAGRTYFMLYRNTGGIIRSGHEIAILVGNDSRISHVVPG